MEATDGIFVDFEEHDGTPLAEHVFSAAEDEFFSAFDIELDEIDTSEVFGLRDFVKGNGGDFVVGRAFVRAEREGVFLIHVLVKAGSAGVIGEGLLMNRDVGPVVNGDRLAERGGAGVAGFEGQDSACGTDETGGGEREDAGVSAAVDEDHACFR